MSPLYTAFVLYSAVAYVLIIAFDVFKRRWTALIELGGLLFFLALLHRTMAFPRPTFAFGGIPTLAAIPILYVFTLLGGAASYVYNLEGTFSWRDFLRPIVISPILFMPLMSSVITTHNVETLQLVSLGLLAFQNGFFWKVVFGRAKRHV